MLELSQLVGNFPITEETFLFFFPVIARAKKKEKDGNYEITTTTNSMQTGKKKTGNSHLSESPLLRP
jgi:hypothetical protein